MTRSSAEPHRSVSGSRADVTRILLALEAATSWWPADRAATQVLLRPRATTANGIGRASAPEELDKASRAVAGARIVDLAEDAISRN
jgi:hypothetical protein